MFNRLSLIILLVLMPLTTAVFLMELEEVRLAAVLFAASLLGAGVLIMLLAMGTYPFQRRKVAEQQWHRIFAAAVVFLIPAAALVYTILPVVGEAWAFVIGVVFAALLAGVLFLLYKEAQKGE